MNVPHDVFVPEAIETRRLRLRPFRESDAAALHEALVESIAALREHLWFLPWVAEEPTLESARRRCERAQAAFIERSDLAYLAFHAETGRLVGSAGWHRTDWAAGKTEVGFWIRTRETGKGFATEAVNAFTEQAFAALRARRVEFVADELNLASLAVARRCGFELEHTRHRTAQSPDGRWRNTLVHVRVAPHDAAGQPAALQAAP